MLKVKSNITCMSPPVGLTAYYLAEVDNTEADIENGIAGDVCDLIECPVASLVYAETDGVIKVYIYVFNAHVVDPRNHTMMEVNEVIGGSLIYVGLPGGVAT